MTDRVILFSRDHIHFLFLHDASILSRLYEMWDANNDGISLMAYASKGSVRSLLWAHDPERRCAVMPHVHRTQAYDHQWLDTYMCFLSISRVSSELSRDV